MSEILTDRPSAKAGPRWFNYRVTLRISVLVSEAFEFVERRRASMPRQIARWAAAGGHEPSLLVPCPRFAARRPQAERRVHGHLSCAGLRTPAVHGTWAVATDPARGLSLRDVVPGKQRPYFGWRGFSHWRFQSQSVASRNPTVSWRRCRVFMQRLDERTSLPWLYHAPPRTTRERPLGGPCGSICGLLG